MRAFLDLLLLMFINKRCALYDHFSDNPFTSSIVKEIINRTKFFLIWKYLHLSNNEIQIKQSCKVNKMVSFFTERWISLYKPSQNLSIDESMIAFRGRIKYLQYEPLKPTKFGLKAWT